MLKEPLQNDSPAVVKARSAFGIIAFLGFLAVTADVFWSRMRKKGDHK